VMSFGYSAGDGILLVQLAWKTLQGARKACGEHDELTREVASLHRVLQRLHKELTNPDSLLNRADDDRRQELNEHSRGCEGVLNVMNSIVTRYNKLSDTERSRKGVWQKVKFGNGEVKNLAEIRLKLSAHTSIITMSLNLCSLGSQGRVEKQLSDMGGDLQGIRGKVDRIAANMTARSGDGTVWTSYENDDKSFWRQLRRELVREGYRSSVLHKHKGLLKDYVEELGRRGVFNQVDSEDSEENEEEDEDSPRDVESEENASDVTESEGSEPGDSDHDLLLLNDNADQPGETSGPESAYAMVRTESFDDEVHNASPYRETGLPPRVVPFRSRTQDYSQAADGETSSAKESRRKKDRKSRKGSDKTASRSSDR
jgi:hypothetical protein